LLLAEAVAVAMETTATVAVAVEQVAGLLAGFLLHLL